MHTDQALHLQMKRNKQAKCHSSEQNDAQFGRIVYVHYRKSNAMFEKILQGNVTHFLPQNKTCKNFTQYFTRYAQFS